jgi:hypothetical protein
MNRGARYLAPWVIASLVLSTLVPDFDHHSRIVVASDGASCLFAPEQDAATPDAAAQHSHHCLTCPANSFNLQSASPVDFFVGSCLITPARTHSGLQPVLAVDVHCSGKRSPPVS